MEQRERRRRGIERLARQVQHDRAVFADRVKHDGPFGFGHHFTHDVDGLRLKALQVGKAGIHGHSP